MHPLYWESVIKLKVPIGQVHKSRAPLIEKLILGLTRQLQIKICNDVLICISCKR